MVNIDFVVQKGLCTGCGTCAGICPAKAVTMCVSENGLYLAKIEEKKCIQCGLCVKCCPGHFTDFDDLNKRIFGRLPSDVLIGNYLDCFVAHSNDESIMYNCSSGGLVTSLLVFALENGLIDGALVTRMSKGNPLEPEPFIARTKDDIISASGSKYCPVASNTALRQIQERDGKFAVVGLPCQIHGIRKAETAVEGLKGKIVLHIGLFCSHTTNFAGTEFLLNKLQVNKNEVVQLGYRGKGWPGSMSIQLRSDKCFDIPYMGWNAYWSIFTSFFFTPMRCLMCPDHFNELSDISAGDAWLPELRHSDKGWSMIIARTRESEKMLSNMKSKGMIASMRVTTNKVKRSQAFSLDFKKEKISRRLSFLKMVGYPPPRTNPSLTRNCYTSLEATLPYFNIQVSSNKHLRSLLRHVPFPVFRIYFRLFYVLFGYEVIARE